MAGDPLDDRRSAWLPSLTAGATALVSSFVLRAFTCDDAAITYLFAEQAGAGQPLGTVVAGDPIVSGFSNPTWTLILATGARLGLPVAGTAKVLGILCFVLTAVLATRLIGRLVQRPNLAWIGCAIGASTTVATWSVSGLENALVGLLVVTAALLLVAEEQDERTGWRAMGSSAAVAALVVSRPDTFVYLPVAALARSLATRRRVGPGPRPVAADLARWSLLPAVALGGWTIFSLRRFGYPLANTVYAKVHLTVTDRVTQLADLRSGPIQTTATFALVTGAALLVPLMAGCWLRRRTPTTTVTVLALGTLILPFSETDWMANYRFYAVSVPLGLVLAAVGLDAILERSAARERRPAGSSSPLFTPTRLGVGLVAAWGLVNVAGTVQVAREDFPGQVTVARIRDLSEPMVAAQQRWGLADPLVMSADAGAVVDDLDLRLLDMAGLLDPQVSHLMDDGARRQEYAFAERRPDLVRAGHPWWNWNQLWELTPETMAALGYVALPESVEPQYIRRDLLVRPADPRNRSQPGPVLDDLLVPSAVDGGELVARAWVQGDPSDDTTAIRFTLRRTDGATDRSTLLAAPLGSDVLPVDGWTRDEAVLHLARLTLPAGSGPLELTVDAVDGSGRSSRLATEPIAVGGPAAEAAAASLAHANPATVADSIGVLQGLDDLAVAAPGHADGIESIADDVRADALDRLAIELDVDLDEGADPDATEPARQAIDELRGRQHADETWRALAERYRVEAERSAPERRYRLLVIAAAADPSSPEIQKQLLAARDARTPRSAQEATTS